MCPVFVFLLLQRAPYQKHSPPRGAYRANHKAVRFQKKREWNGGIGGLCTLHKPVFHRRFCRGICFSGATWLDLPNLVARTEYHSRLVLSTLILRFFSQKRFAAGISAFFLHSAQRNSLALAENPLVFYCFLKGFLLL